MLECVIHIVISFLVFIGKGELGRLKRTQEAQSVELGKLTRENLGSSKWRARWCLKRST